MYKTHIVFALFCYLLLAIIFGLEKEFYALLVLAISALLPDIDSASSYINNKFKLGKVIALTTKHRGFWHSVFGLLAIIVITAIIFYLIDVNLALCFYVAFGYLMHLLADSLTISGIKPFWRYSDFELKWKIKTNSIFEYVLFFILLVLTLYLYSPKFVFSITGFIAKIFE